MELPGPSPCANRPNSSVLDWIHWGPSLERLSSLYSAICPVSGFMAVPCSAQWSSYQADWGGMMRAVAAVPMARRCLSGLRPRCLMLRRAPRRGLGRPDAVGALGGVSIGEPVGAGETGATNGSPIGVVLGARGSAGCASGATTWRLVGGTARGIRDGTGDFLRELRLVASRYVIAGGSSPPECLPPSNVAHRMLRDRR